MTSSKPEFHLRRVDADGGAGPVEIFPVHALPADAQLSRRGLLGAGVTVGAVLASLRPDPAAAQTTAAKKADAQPAPAVINAHLGIVYGLAVSADGKTLATASWDKSVKAWSLPDGKLLRAQRGHAGGVRSMTACPDGKTLAFGTGEATVHFWAPPDGRLDRAAAEHASSVCALAVTPDGRTLAAGSYKAVKLLGLPGGRPGRTLAGHAANVVSLAVTPDGKTLVSGSDDKTVKFWSLPDGKLSFSLSEHTGAVRALAVAPNGKTLASASADKTIKLWSLPDGAFLRTLTGHAGDVNALALVPGGKALVSGSGDKTVRLWSLPDGQPVRTFAGHAAAVRAVAVTPDGKTVVSGDDDGVVILWDIATAKPLRYLFDPAASQTNGFVYHVKDQATGQTVSYTLPCGSPVPAGATCTCNCVPGTYRPPVVTLPVYVPPPEPEPYYPPARPTTGGGFYCTCNKICTCIPVCQAHKVLDPDPVVRTMAEELLLTMGVTEFPYMTWAAAKAPPAVTSRIGEIMAAIRRGADPDPARWPAADACAPYLAAEDEVVGVMAAQMIRKHACRADRPVDPRVAGRVESLLDGARQRPWHVRAAAG